MPRKGKGQNVSRSELAAIFGVALTTIDSWVRSGCPFKQQGGKGKQWVFNTADVSAWREDTVRQNVTGGKLDDAETLKLRKLSAETQKAELDLALATGQVAPISQIEQAAAHVFAEVKTAMRQIPSRVVSILVGETEPKTIKAVLLSEIDQALQNLADADLVTVAEIDPDEGEDDDTS